MILYKSTETAFQTNGIGILSDAILCEVTSELNGQDELVLQYPADGIHADRIEMRSIVLADRNHSDAPQPYRIYNISEPLNGVVTYYARHISYDLSGIPVHPFSADNAVQALNGLAANAAVPCPFSFLTNKSTAAKFSVKVPSSIRALLGGQEGSVLDVFGGEYAFDRFSVYLQDHRGMDRGTTIRYGKNLTSLQQDRNCDAVYTGIYPYWSNAESITVTLPEKIIYADGHFDFVRILPLDFSAEWEEEPTENQLRTRAERYIRDNDIGVPKISLTVSFVQLADTLEYKDVAQMELVELGDTVHVHFPRMAVTASARVVSMVYDAILKQYKQITLGSVRSNIATTIAAQNAEIKKVSEPAFLQSAVQSATQLITGNKGGYVVLHSSTGGAAPDEILVMDTPSVSTAKNVWRWNKQGFGYSNNGYDGPFETAITMDGKIVADFIAAGTLDAAQIKVLNLIASKVQSVNDLSSLEITGAALKLFTDQEWTVNLSNAFDGLPILYMRDIENGEQTSWMELSPHHMKIGGNNFYSPFQVFAGSNSSTVFFSSLEPDGVGNCAWEYDSTIDKTILVKKT